MLKAFLVGVLGLGSLVVTVIMMFVSANNQDSTLRNSFTAKESSREAIYDETWKTIKQIAQVSDKYSKDFKEIYPALMEGRYKEGGTLAKFVTEANPNFDTALYGKLMNVIEAKRSEFTRSQEELIDIKREHDNLLTLFPSTFFVMNKTRLVVTVVSSDKSKEVIKSGVENDVNLF